MKRILKYMATLFILSAVTNCEPIALCYFDLYQNGVVIDSDIRKCDISNGTDFGGIYYKNTWKRAN